MQRRFQQVDVFSTVPYKGNPLGVVLDGDGLEDEAMRNYSLWSNLSEATFILPARHVQADYRFRILARDREYPFAGHPALGTARAWLQAGGVPRDPKQLIAECGAGLVPIRIDGELLSFASPPATRTGAIGQQELAEMLQILGIGTEQVVDAQWVDNGPGWAAILLQDAQQVLEISAQAPPRFGRWKIGVLGALPPSTPGGGFEVRALTIENGAVREDPVTGSLNGAAAQWLIDAGHAAAPLVNRQGAKAGRDGEVHLEMADGQLWVGGATNVLIEGNIDL